MKYAVSFAIAIAVLIVLPKVESGIVEGPDKKVGTERLSFRIFFVGDVMLDRHVAVKIDQYGLLYTLQNIRDYLLSFDGVVGNAEGVFSENRSATKGVNDAPLRFTFSTTTVSLLKEANFVALSQANNHTLDFGIEAAKFSRDFILKNGVVSFGDYYNKNPGPVFLEKNGIKLALIGFNEFGYTGNESILEAIKKAKSENAIAIVYAHWGEEYVWEPTSFQKKTAKEFIDSGADVVIGAHPHVIQPIEIYKGKPIFYSLGNFIFDQGFGETLFAIGVVFNIFDEKIVFEIAPLTIGIGTVKLSDSEIRDKVLSKLGFSRGFFEVEY